MASTIRSFWSSVRGDARDLADDIAAEVREEGPRAEDQAWSLFDQFRAEASAAGDSAGRELDRAEDQLRQVFEDAPDWLRERREDAERGFRELRSDLEALRPWIEEQLAEQERAAERPPADGTPSLDGSAFRDALALAGLGDLGASAEIRTLDNLAALLDELPLDLAGPDETGEAPTGGTAIPREQAATAATLAAAARVVDALGPTAETMVVRGQAFEIAETYRDPMSGFLAVRLTPLVPDGPVVFSVDGLQVGSRADEVAAATLGRLQVGSDAFAAMVADAAEIALAGDRDVLFTGPSLGGVGAQVAAYQAAEALLASGEAFDTGAIKLVTVDPLGGRDAAEWAKGGELDPAALELIAALNLRTEGDLVSRIGSHIGATRTLPALDAEGNPVALDAGDAHVNTVSLMQVLNSDALFASGVDRAPAEIGGFARASAAASEELIEAWRLVGTPEEPARDLQIRGESGFDAARTEWWVDLDENGTGDIVVRLSTPYPAGDSVIG